MRLSKILGFAPCEAVLYLEVRISSDEMRLEKSQRRDLPTDKPRQ